MLERENNMKLEEDEKLMKDEIMKLLRHTLI